MSYIIVAQPPVVQNPMTEEDPVRFTTGDNIEELIAAGAPTLVRPATIEAVRVERQPETEELDDIDDSVDAVVQRVSLELFKKHIDGFIEVAYSIPLHDRRRETIDFVGDEEALLKKLTPTLVRPTDGWVLRGPLVVCRATSEGEHVSLTQRFFDDVWGMFTVLGFVDKKRLPSD